MLKKAALTLAFAGLAWPASAQIYSWRDASGNLVLSSKRESAAARTYTVTEAAASTVRVTTPVTVTRSQNFDDLIVEHARLNNVRTDLVRAVVQVESGFNVYARSAKGALGLMQLMPATIKTFGVVNPFNPVENIRAGVEYLRMLLDRYNNNETLALAAYNAGPNAVDRHGQKVPPYKETRKYVSQISQIAAQPGEKKGAVTIYKVTEIVDGKPTTRYTDQKPATGTYVVVGHR